MSMRRREFFNAAALTAGGAALTAALPGRADARQARTPAAVRPGSFKMRPAPKVEILFMAPPPGVKVNGMQVTEEGIWTIEQAGSRSDTPGRCRVHLQSHDGKLIRSLTPEGIGPSGIGVTPDNKVIWIGSTYSREIIEADAMTGETISKRFTPGAGVIYRMTTDPPARPATWNRNNPARGAAAGGRRGGGEGGRAGGEGRGAARGAVDPATVGGFSQGYATPVPGQSGALGTGAHGIQTQKGKIWVSVPPGRMIYRIDPATWMVEHMFPSIGNRPHGIGMAGNNNVDGDDYLWESDTNWGAFFKRHIETGEVVDAIRLADGDPFPHGMSVYNNYIYWSEDIAGNSPICRIPI